MSEENFLLIFCFIIFSTVDYKNVCYRFFFPKMKFHSERKIFDWMYKKYQNETMKLIHNIRWIWCQHFISKCQTNLTFIRYFDPMVKWIIIKQKKIVMEFRTKFFFFSSSYFSLHVNIKWNWFFGIVGPVCCVLKVTSCSLT